MRSPEGRIARLRAAVRAAAVIVSDLQPDSIGARAGLQAGDRIRRANGQTLKGRTDWQRVRVHLDPSKPLDLERRSTPRSVTVRLPLRAGLSEWRSGPARPGLLAFRLGANHHARLRARRGVQTAFANRPPCSVPCSSRPLPHYRWCSRCAWSPSGTPCRPVLGVAPVGAVRDERRRGPVAVCLLRGVPAAHLVDDQARRRAPPGGAHRRLAPIRLVSHHAGSSDRRRGCRTG